MAEIIREKKDPQNILCKITIEPEDYNKDFQKELKKYQQEGNFKGFRKGKAPIGFVRKMYGKSAMANQVNKILQDKLMEVMQEELQRLLGQPIPSESQQPVDFDPETPGTFEFHFDMGLSPEIDEIAGLNSDATFEQPMLQIPDEMIDKELETIRMRVGESTFIEENIEGNDMVAIDAVELEGDTPKENGWETNFTVLVNDMVEDKKEEMLGKGVDFTFDFDIFNLEKDLSDDLVRKHLLKEEDVEKAAAIGHSFRGTVRQINRRIPAEMNEDFFKQAFPSEEITNEEEAREFLKSNIEKYFNSQADSILWQFFRQHLIDHNPLELPDDFLKRWLLYSNEELTKTQMENEYPVFAENTKWSLIKRKLLDDFQITINDDEINTAIQEAASQRFGSNLDPATMAMIISHYRENEEQMETLKEDLITDKLFHKIKEHVTLTPVLLSQEEFVDRIKEMKESFLKKSVKQETEIAESESENE